MVPPSITLGLVKIENATDTRIVNTLQRNQKALLIHASSQVEIFEFTKELEIPVFLELRGANALDFDTISILRNASIAAFMVMDSNWKIVAHRNGAAIEYRGSLEIGKIEQFIGRNRA